MHLIAIGGSDGGISAALRARELDPSAEVTVVVADAYPNFSICGIPYYVSGEVTHWRNLAHRTLDDLKATGMQVRLNTLATTPYSLLKGLLENAVTACTAIGSALAAGVFGAASGIITGGG